MQKDHRFKVSLSYLVRPCLKIEKWKRARDILNSTVLFQHIWELNECSDKHDSKQLRNGNSLQVGSKPEKEWQTQTHTTGLIAPDKMSLVHLHVSLRLIVKWGYVP